MTDTPALDKPDSFLPAASSAAGAGALPAASSAAGAGALPAASSAAGTLPAAGAGASTPQQEAYLALARKYRPQHFGDLVGQEAMVRTLQNAFKSGRIAHAFLLTGVRGVGKTTTARILARALNYQTQDGDSEDLAQLDFSQALAAGVFCDEIMQGRHTDVVELDAASHGGIDDVRNLIEQVRYRPLAARYKVYIIDEVHMLSTEAFNGLLKTLEEPPPHVKFIFATTEIRKVPVTILSRCQRFDLRRLTHATTQSLLARVCEQEGASLPDDILNLLARAADGSARDGLSLLDRILAHGRQDGAPPSLDEVRAALGLADKARGFDLLEHILKGDVPAALVELEEQYRLGADAAQLVAELAELTHWLGRLKFIPQTEAEPGLSEAQQAQARTIAETIAVPDLARLWQILLKGHQEILQAPTPLAAAEMLVLRLAHIAPQPTPDALARQWAQAGAPQPSEQAEAAASPMLQSAKNLFPGAEVVAPSEKT